MNISKSMIKIAESKRAKIMLAAKYAVLSDKDAAEMCRPSDEFLSSKEWKLLRSSVIEKYGRTCMKCGRTTKRNRDINVDHIKPRKTHPELSMCFDNLQVLCGQCNKLKGNKHCTDYRKKEHG